MKMASRLIDLISDFLPNKTLSCICIAIPFDWVILHWYASGAHGRSVGRCTVTWLPNFLEWVDYHVSLAMGLRPRAARGAPLSPSITSSLSTLSSILLAILSSLNFFIFSFSISYFSFGDISVNPFYLKFGGNCSFHGGVVCVRAARSQDTRSEGDSPGWKMRDCSWVNNFIYYQLKGQ